LPHQEHRDDREGSDSGGRPDDPPGDTAGECRGSWLFVRRLRCARRRRGARLSKHEHDIVQRVESLLRILLQAVRHRVSERRRHARLRQLWRFFLEYGGHRLGGRSSLERLAPSQQLVKNRSEGEDVRAVVEDLAPHLLG
jgi:hypothetical protein